MASNHSRTRSAFAANAAVPLARTTSTASRHSRSRRRATVSGAPNQKLTWGLPPDDGASTPKPPADNVSREASTINLALIAQLLTENKLDTDTYGVTEARDGFFDAFFLQPPSVEYDELLESVEPTLPKGFRSTGPFSVQKFVRRKWDDVKAIAVEIFTTRSGLLLFKSFLAFYIAYVLCLVPTIREWLGRYSYIMAVSTIVNHPGRTVGSQIDGTVLTTIGTAIGLGWGAVGLALSTSTSDAQTGFAGVLALFLAVFMGFIAFMRSYFIRLYQLVICGGMAIIYTCLAEVDGQQVKWSKIYGYAIPWLLGQAIALVVCLVVYPDAGARPLAEVFHRAFGVMLDGLVIPRPRSHEMRQRLSQAFFDLSVAHREMKLDITIARFRARDIKELRGHVQGVIRGLLSMKIDNEIFEDLLHSRPATRRSGLSVISEKSVDGRSGNPRARTWAPSLSDDDAQAKGLRVLQGPTQALVEAMDDGLRACDAAFMDMSGYRSFLGPPKDVSSDVVDAEKRIATAVKEFDEAEGILSGSQESQGYNPEIIRLLVLARSVRMTTDPIIKLMARMHEMKAQSNHIRFDPPAYAFWKSLNRSNAQVRHDRGTVTPSSYSQTFARISELVNKIKAREHHPIIDDFGEDSEPDDTESVTKAVEPSQRLDSVRHRTWRALRRLQGFDGKFALRVVVMTGVLSAPAYVQSSRGWWNQHDAWWAVVMGWVMSHTMVGGSLADLVVRSSIVVMSALWSGFAWAARDGNPIVMAAFALIYMFPMMYRFTRSSHPRSGLAGCLSFTVVSLGLVSSGGASPPAAVRGLAFLVGVVAATIVNWVLWPFIARHQLRKSVSSMLFFLSVIYRDMVAKYVYYEHSHPPTPTDVQQSESLESHLREGFIRIRQLLYLTPHELRLRGPFDPVPYLALIDACEAFFDDLITVRQAALFYAADFARRGDAARAMLGHRRDAVAAVLTNLYVLSGALRAGSKVPSHLPSAAVSRRRLLDRMAEMEAETPEAPDPDERSREKWALIYRYSYNESLTRCVAHLEDMERWTKLILGERGFDDAFMERDDEDYE